VRLQAVLTIVVIAQPAISNKSDGVVAGPLCHAQFRALERCLGNDYERLKSECSPANDDLQGCFSRDWKHIDDAGGYRRGDKGFNRMKLCRHGVFLYNPLDWYIGRAMEVYGEWGERKVHIFEKIVKPDHVVVDIGAHIGTLSLPLSKLVGAGGRVLAIEPFYPSFAALAANAGLNSYQNLEVRQAVVADRSGRLFMNRDSLVFGMNDFFNFGSMSFNTMRIYNATEDIERPSNLWDEYAVMQLDELSLARLDFLKIDAESMELAVLQGGTRLLKKFKPMLFIEYRSPWEKETTILDFLRKKLKYECVLLRVPIFNVDNFRGQAEDIWGTKTKLVSFNLLCKHRWWDYPDTDEGVLQLFDTAVDTDIEGLRTTPTADPFEAMAMAEEDGSFGGGSFRDAREEDEEDVHLPPHTPPADKPVHQSAANPAKKPASLKAPKTAAQKVDHRQEEMTLDELLGGEESGDDEMEEEITLDDLLGGGVAHSESSGGKREAELTLDDLLGPEEPTSHAAKTKSSAGAKKPSVKPKTAQPRQEELTLDDLLGPEPSRPVPKASIPKKAGKSPAPAPKPPSRSATPRREELTLDELLGPETPLPSTPKTKSAKPLSKPSSVRPPPSKTKRPKHEEELTLDELLAGGGIDDDLGIPETQDADVRGVDIDSLFDGPGDNSGIAGTQERVQEMSLDDLLGPQEPGDSKYEEMTLDQLLDAGSSFPDEDRAADQAMLDELLGPESLDPKYEDMSLDELLALDDPEEAIKSKPAPKPKPQPPPPRKAAQKTPKSPTAGESPSQNKKAKKTRPASAGSGPAKGGKGMPHVKLDYSREPSLDEL